MNRQQRRFQERQEKGLRKQSDIKYVRKLVKLEDIKITDDTDRMSPEFREKWSDYIIDLKPKDIKRIDVHKYELKEGQTHPYMDDYVCVLMNMEQSVPKYDEVEQIDLQPFHEKRRVKGLNDMWEISNTGWFNTRDRGNTYFHPFVVFDKDGEECSLPLDSKFLQLWDNYGKNIYEKELPLFYRKYQKWIQLTGLPTSFVNSEGDMSVITRHAISDEEMIGDDLELRNLGFKGNN